MYLRASKPDAAFVARAIEELVRSGACESSFVEITRPQGFTKNSLGERIPTQVPIYRGEAVILPATGTVQRFGMGQVENMTPTMVIVGVWAILQGDFIVWKGRKYQVKFPAEHYGAYTSIKLDQFQQGK